jgi:lipoyl(octanoyl) transferase
MEIRRLGLVDYATAFEAMKVLTRERDAQTEDQLWLLQHPPVFTQGISGKPEHVLSAGTIPVVQIDRGGQVTYHGPGQWVLYALIDLKRRGLTVRALVTALEDTVITLLAQYGITATADPKAPGVYVSGRKIASLGLKVSRGCSYHGLAFNVDLDLAPFLQINPCGFPGLEVTSLAQLLAESPDMRVVGEELIAAACAQLP